MYKVRFVFIAILFSLVHFLGASESYKTLFVNKKILITGGTGFLGRALAKGILKYNPHQVVVFSRDEVKHHTFLEKINDKRVKSVIGDVRNYVSIDHAVKGMDIVIHAAALKRVDMMEYNVAESIYTNTLGTLNVARACLRHSVKQVLLVSTDKACLPVNTYGACKFIAEKIFSNFALQSNESKFLIVRYGNVLESTGSVIPYFCEKIRDNQKIPLTDEAMTRFFIAKEQAIELIFKTLKYGEGGEIFVPNLSAFKIIDLISVLQKRLAAYPGVKVIGLRPGEKIHEVMINHTEVPRTYKFKDMFVIMPTISSHIDSTVYMIHGQKFDPAVSEYSSGEHVLSSKELDELLIKYDIKFSYKSRPVIRRVL